MTHHRHPTWPPGSGQAVELWLRCDAPIPDGVSTADWLLDRPQSLAGSLALVVAEPLTVVVNPLSFIAASPEQARALRTFAGCPLAVRVELIIGALSGRPYGVLRHDLVIHRLFPHFSSASLPSALPLDTLLADARLTRRLLTDHRDRTPPHRHVLLRDRAARPIAVTREDVWADTTGALTPSPPLSSSATPAASHPRP